MATLTRRLQILVDEDRLARLARTAERRGTTVAALVRDALDKAYPPSGLDPEEAAERFLDRPPIDLGTWNEAKRDIEGSLERGLPR